MKNPFSELATRMGFNRGANLLGLERFAKSGRYKPQEYSDQDLEHADTIHAYIFGAIRAIADNVANTPICLYKDRERIESHPALKLIENPSKFMPANGLKESITKHLLLTGDCFIEIISNKYRYEDGRVATVPKQLIPIIPPSSVKIVPGKSELVDHYVYKSPTGEDLNLPVDEVAHIRLFSASSKLYGLSPLQALKEELFTDAQAVEYNKQFFESSAAPGGILSSDQTMNPDSKDDLERRWNRAHRGTSNAHKIAVLDRGLEYQPVSLSQEDMQFIEQRKLTKREIRALYGVPATYLGETNATYASANEASRAFFLNVVIPMANRISKALTKFVLRRHWPNQKLEFRFNFLANEALVPLVREKAELQRVLIEGGIPPNMASKMIWGQEFYDDDIGQTAFLPANLVPMGSVPTSVKEPGPQLSLDTEDKEIDSTQIDKVRQNWQEMMKNKDINMDQRQMSNLEDKLDKLGQKIEDI